MVKHTIGDIFKADTEVLVHGCNTFCTFGAGVAYYVKKFYPKAYEEDKKTNYGDKNKLGTFTFWKGNHYFLNKEIIIINAYTQHYANKSLKPFDYNAFEKVLPLIKNQFNNKIISFPRIGAGLAGGDWIKIENIMNSIFNDLDVYVYTLSNEVNYFPKVNYI